VIAEPKSEDREDADERNKRKRLERALDEALKCTFPASDPFSVEQPMPYAADLDRGSAPIHRDGKADRLRQVVERDRHQGESHA
jgi:hypothetical protein